MYKIQAGLEKASYKQRPYYHKNHNPTLKYIRRYIFQLIKYGGIQIIKSFVTFISKIWFQYFCITKIDSKIQSVLKWFPHSTYIFNGFICCIIHRTIKK